ncbi:carboxypeptidase-like regulatory domain-containing protein [Deinococcus apachensis]|uniref:carboxypeptidase-like regulatory domain-containing protein n=1 Tax=Deinococcus apachensis TaxID=309886 RepID=UPI00036AA192|nr:carboxypeptidase-like regulatory domain-containing protein [Deinococcus apachensis]
MQIILMTAVAGLVLSAFAASSAGTSTRAVPNTLTGRVLDAAGKPVADAEVWIKPVSFSGLIKTRTDAQGQYQSPALNPALAPYQAQAYKVVNYHGEKACIRMGGETSGDFDVFNAKAGAVRNFRWKMRGEAEGGYDGKMWGGNLRFYNESVTMPGNIQPNEILEVHLLPNGRLIDGSAGEDWEYTDYAGNGVKDIPVGRYDLWAFVVNKDGTRTPLKLKADNSVQKTTWGTKITVLFDGIPDCGHYATFLETPIAVSR